MDNRTKDKQSTTHERTEINKLLLRLGKDDPALSYTELKSSPMGLTTEEATVRISDYGKNEVAYTKPPVWWVQFFQSFASPFTLILIVIGITSYITDVYWAKDGGDWTKIALIALMIVLSGSLRFWQEFKSQKSAEKLKALVQNKVSVSRCEYREGERKECEQEINVSGLVPGDVVHLSAGDMVPADLRLISSNDFFVDESALTGESAPVEKFAKPITPSEEREAKKDVSTNNPLELNTLCFLGTNVVSGYAVGIVVATGDRTYFGSLAKNIIKERPLTSFDIGVSKVSMVLIYFIVIMAPLVFILNGITKHDWQEALLFALAVAVGLTPEMLPLVITANLAKGAVNMSKKKVVVKKLNAIQNLGAMNILCTDKTGTLTENRVVLVRHLNTKGDESEKVLKLAYLNSFFQTGLKNLMDQAVVFRMDEKRFGEEERAYSKVDEIPFDFARRRLSVVVEKKDAERLLVCKGATEEVLGLCTHVEEGDVVVPITEAVVLEAKEFVRKLNNDGLRVVLVAYKTVEKDKEIYSTKDENNLTLVGYIGFLDPPKASAKEAIQLLESHGVTVKIITGDNEIVTSRICRDVGLFGDELVLLGNDIAHMSDEELGEKAEGVSIFARIDPIQKARIIHVLKSRGHTVAFMGDGINDAAAMKEADVGISVDTAVDIAKESADIILLEKDLRVLDQGVIEGRMIFGNITKYIKMTSSSNFGNTLSVFVASVFLPFLPMLPIHLLIQNLLYDISQLSLPWDRMDEEFLQKPRKWEAGGMVRFMLFVGPISSFFDIVTFAVLWFVFSANTGAEQSLFQSGWFIEGLLSQVLIVHMIRTQKIPFIQSRATKPVMAMTVIILLIGIAIPFTPMGAGVGFEPLPLSYFAILITILLAYFVVVQVVKVLYIKKFKTWL